ncbi:MAG: hypothetical protein KDD28_18690 [Phaeodactylibacter sp.]|nr:hypothetical protein [Phaeodactylibacter sp.]
MFDLGQGMFRSDGVVVFLLFAQMSRQAGNGYAVDEPELGVVDVIEATERCKFSFFTYLTDMVVCYNFFNQIAFYHSSPR